MRISEPTKVTSSTKAMDSGSISMPTLTWKLPAGIQLYKNRFSPRNPSGRPSIAI